jgi:hypothetical protein
VLLSAAAGHLNLWAGLFAVWMVAGTICTSTGLLAEPADVRHFLAFCGTSALIAVLIEFSNHVVLPLIILTCGIALILIVQSVRTYQFRKYWSGGEP